MVICNIYKHVSLRSKLTDYGQWVKYIQCCDRLLRKCMRQWHHRKHRLWVKCGCAVRICKCVNVTVRVSLGLGFGCHVRILPMIESTGYIFPSTILLLPDRGAILLGIESAPLSEEEKKNFYAYTTFPINCIYYVKLHCTVQVDSDKSAN